jgi:hypothetical protein
MAVTVFLSKHIQIRSRRCLMVVGFTTTSAIGDESCEFELRLWRGVLVKHHKHNLFK